MFNLSHPKNKDSFRSFLAEKSLSTLIIYYVLFNTGISVLYSLVIYPINGNFDITFRSFYIRVMFDLLGNSLSELNLNSLLLYYVHSGLSTYYSILVPAILLGVIVFKVMITSDILVFKNIFPSMNPVWQKVTGS